MAVVPFACSPDDGADPRGTDRLQEDEVRQAEVERRLNLALSSVEADAELRDEGEAASSAPEIPDPAPGEGASAEGASEGEPDPEATAESEAEPAPEAEPEPEAATDPAPDSEVEAPAPAPDPDTDEAVAPDPSPEGEEVADAAGAPSPEGDARAEAEGGETEPAERHTLPAGSRFQVEFLQQLNSAWTQPGDVFLATLSAPLIDGEGRVIAPTGTEVVGEVTAVRQPDGDGEEGSIEVAFTQVVIDGQSYPIDATAETATRLETVGGTPAGPGRGDRAARGALTGGILGAILGGSGRNAAIGAGAGAAIGALRGGDGDGSLVQVALAAGSTVQCVTNTPFVGPPISVASGDWN
ncbi:MAG: hypothetical protein RQ745_06555 [Longimicrobiales bacterium]|nr:hypothetical protein [Longimicrobiales bacterium]